MISGKNYFTITVVMLVVFFMFQFTNVVLEGWNGYEENAYAQDRESLIGQGSAYRAGQEETESGAGSSRERIVYIGSADETMGRVVQSWVNYTKRELDVYDTAQACQEAANGVRPAMLVMDAAHMDWEQDGVCRWLKECAQQGTSLVFGSLPEISVIKENRELRQLLGIEGIRADEMTAEGIHLYEGFLLGGEIVYRSEDAEENAKKQDMELTFPWYQLAEDAEVYMCGIPEEEVKIEERPPVIWQNSSGDARVFAVNGGYMEDTAGLGILTAMSAETKAYEVYPVINAQNMVIVGAPAMASEYEEEMERQYGQPMTELFRNIVWPATVSMYRRSALGLTCMLAPQYDYEDDRFPAQTELEFYMKRLKEQSAEAGLSGENMSGTPTGQKLDEDDRFVKELLPDYRFTSFYTGELTETELDAVLQEDILKEVRTVAGKYDGSSEVVGYQSEYITRQDILFDGVNYTYRDDFRMRSVETALGYTSVGLDIGQAIYPDNGQEDIDRILSDFSWNVRTYWRNFSAFSGVVLSESDQRIRSFLALDYEVRQEENMIYLDFDGVQAPAWFVLKTDGGRILDVQGGRFSLVEKGVYLIEAESASVAIEVSGGEKEGKR